jgi:DDE superfamily endonuclease
VVSADENSQLQALSRCHPGLGPAPGRPRRVEPEYDRHGTLAYFGAYDVHRATVVGHVAPTTGIVPFAALVKKVMSAEPYASARRVYWVVDNGPSHAGRASIKRMGEGLAERPPWSTSVTLVHLPVHASWLNQVEVVFSVMQRKVVKGGDFADLSALAEALVRFEARDHTTAKAFVWTFTRADLVEPCRRIDAHTGPAELALVA